MNFSLFTLLRSQFGCGSYSDDADRVLVPNVVLVVSDNFAYVPFWLCTLILHTAFPYVCNIQVIRECVGRIPERRQSRLGLQWLSGQSGLRLPQLNWWCCSSRDRGLLNTTFRSHSIKFLWFTIYTALAHIASESKTDLSCSASSIAKSKTLCFIRLTFDCSRSFRWSQPFFSPGYLHDNGRRLRLGRLHEGGHRVQLHRERPMQHTTERWGYTSSWSKHLPTFHLRPAAF